jgi:hypothetical protein
MVSHHRVGLMSCGNCKLVGSDLLALLIVGDDWKSC